MTDTATTTAAGLAGRMLIAMPGMGDPRFDQAVVFMCDHSEQGAMGLIVNKPSNDVDMKALLQQLDISVDGEVGKASVHFGGPVEMGRGFVLHSPNEASQLSTLDVREDIHMTATLDILEELGRGQGPARWLMMLGYSGWGPGQLEAEIADNGWLVCDASPKLIWDTEDADKWDAALESLGVSALVLSAEGGRA